MRSSRSTTLALLFGLATLGLFASAPTAAAQQPADQNAINDAIKLGVKYLQQEQKPAGYWGNGTGPGPGKGWGVGYTALAGLTLAECGVPTTDISLKRAAAIVRANVGELDSTYEVALAIMFLDRLKEKSDKRTIQWLAGRLIAAQMPSGGWGYKVEKHTAVNCEQLRQALKRMTPPADPKEDAPPFDLDKARKAAIASLPGSMRRLPVLFDPAQRLPADPKEKRNDFDDATTDNSNTHFAMLGLWAARKHDVPTDRSFALLNRRFRTSQGPNGTWAYNFAPGGANGPGAHTCIALLGVAMGHVVSPEPGLKPEADPVILNAFVALSKMVGEPVGDTRNRPEVKAVGGLYFLWGMERVAVLYDLQKLGKKDWYQWGAEILVGRQKGDGSWDEDGGYPGQTPIVNTCFALLFLKRANLTPDLSKRLVVDATALTAKVDEKITPKPEPPPPSPKVEEPTEVALAPMPRAVESKPRPAPPSPSVTPTEPTESLPQTQSPPPKKTPWLWIVLGMTLAGGAGGGFAFLFAKRMRKEEKPAKKKKKPKKSKAEVAEEDEG